MTEEEKALFINREATRLKGNFPEMPEGMIDVILEWNLSNENEWVTDTTIDWVTEVAHRNRHSDYGNLLSDNTELAYGTLIGTIGRELARDACKSPKLEMMIERYVFNLQNLAFGDGKTADEVRPLKK